MWVVGGNRNKLRQPLAEPHGDVPVHVDSKRFVAFLQTADSEVLQGADVFAEVHSPHLTHTQTGYRDKTCRQREDIEYKDETFWACNTNHTGISCATYLIHLVI